MKKLKSAIVGCGGIAQTHGEMLAVQETAQLTAFADIKPERARAMAGTYGGNAYASLEEMLEHEQIDVLHICTPHPLHTPMARLAAAKGIHVFTEKPPAVNEEQWAEFAKLQNSGVRVGICFQNRYNAATEFLKELLAGGKPGKILGARAFVTWRRDPPYYTESDWRGSLTTEGGGVLINQSIHTLDLLCWFLGKADKVDATLANHHLKDIIQVEDTFEALADFGGIPAVFYATTAHAADSPVFFELVCEHATLRMEDQEVTVRWKDGSVEHHQLAAPVSPTTGKSYWGSSHGLCMGDFYDGILHCKPFRNDIPGVANTVDLMLAAYRSAREHREITL